MAWLCQPQPKITISIIITNICTLEQEFFQSSNFDMPAPSCACVRTSKVQWIARIFHVHIRFTESGCMTRRAVEIPLPASCRYAYLYHCWTELLHFVGATQHVS